MTTKAISANTPPVENEDKYNPDLLKFYIGGKDTLTSSDLQNKTVTIKKRFQDILQIPNLTFLIGSGCSKYLGIAPFSGLTRTIEDTLKDNTAYKATASFFLKSQSTTINGDEIEKFLGFLYNLVASAKNSKNQFVNDSITLNNQEIKIAEIESLIVELKRIIIVNCQTLDKNRLIFHQQFIKKILQRDSNQSLPRNRIFTTNYDLAFEYSFDSLGVHYFNGFKGNISRVFSPDNFEIDLHYRKAVRGNISRYTQVADLIKLHGSINWFIDNNLDINNLYGIKEVQTESSSNDYKAALVYPTPLKVGNSLNTPYADLFRLFHSSLVQNDSALVVIGYSFSDEHINDIICQALTIPTFKLIVIGDKKLNINGQFFNIDAHSENYLSDPRIWHLSDENKNNKKSHFENFVTDILPYLEEEVFQEKIAETLLKLQDRNNDKSK